VAIDEAIWSWLLRMFDMWIPQYRIINPERRISWIHVLHITVSFLEGKDSHAHVHLSRPSLTTALS
jgi:hypothetical protein